MHMSKGWIVDRDWAHPIHFMLKLVFLFFICFVKVPKLSGHFYFPLFCSFCLPCFQFFSQQLIFLQGSAGRWGTKPQVYLVIFMINRFIRVNNLPILRDLQMPDEQNGVN